MKQVTFNQFSALKDVGRNLRRARIRRNMTSAQLADLAGISRPTVRAVEQGEAGVSLGTLLRVLRALGLEEELLKLAEGDSVGREFHDAELDNVRRVRIRTPAQKRPISVDDEWLDWYRLSPVERWKQSEELLEHFLSFGGSLEPEPDSQSPFFNENEWRETSSHRRPSLRVVRRGGV